MGKLKEVKDFKDTPHYKLYEEKINEYCEDIIMEIMNNNNNDIKYSWNDVLKLVFRYINTELRDFKDSIKMNPTRDEAMDREEQELVKQQMKSLLGR